MSARFIAYFTIKQLVTSAGVTIKDDRLVLKDGIDTGTFVTQIFNAVLTEFYRGFEYICDTASSKSLDQPNNAKFAILWDSSHWIYNRLLDNWSRDDRLNPDYNTAFEMIAGLSSWKKPIQFKCQLKRYPDGLSPKISLIKVGYQCYGSAKAYLVEFGMRKLLSQSVKLTRWVESTVTVFPDVDPSIVAGITTRNDLPGSGTKVLMQAAVSPFIEYIGNQSTEYQIERTPCILIELGETEESKGMQSGDSVRVDLDNRDVLIIARSYHQKVMVHIVAQTQSDAIAISEQIMQKVNLESVIELDGYGQQYGFMVGETLREGITGDIVERMQLPSISFELWLMHISTPATVQLRPILKAIAPPTFN